MLREIVPPWAMFYAPGPLSFVTVTFASPENNYLSNGMSINLEAVDARLSP
jgi:hypothetical protein